MSGQPDIGTILVFSETMHGLGCGDLEGRGGRDRGTGEGEESPIAGKQAEAFRGEPGGSLISFDFDVELHDS